jgi:EAL domain-containing protein (putative c-di-GMP-specific phosphodiesterase class I)
VDAETDSVYAYEALVRGPHGEPAQTVFRQVSRDNLHAFDLSCRKRALTLATELGFLAGSAKLSINFLPGAILDPAACLGTTLDTTRRLGIPHDRLIFEIVESEEVMDLPRLRRIVGEGRLLGFKVAIDDFGAGHASLKMLADFPTDIIKLDMALIRNLHERGAAQAIVNAMIALARTLGSELIAEGVEKVEEYDALRDCGVSLMQGYLFARPAFESLPDFTLPRRKAA